MLRGEDAAEQNFGSGEVCSFGADIAGVVNEIAPNGETGAFDLSFLGQSDMMIWPYVTLRYLGYGRMVDEETGVGAFKAVADSLCKLA
jgi:hypothetical protein